MLFKPRQVGYVRKIGQEDFTGGGEIKEALKVLNDLIELKGEFSNARNRARFEKYFIWRTDMSAGTHSNETVCRCGKIRTQRRVNA